MLTVYSGSGSGPESKGHECSGINYSAVAESRVRITAPCKYCKASTATAAAAATTASAAAAAKNRKGQQHKKKLNKKINKNYSF